MAGSLDVLIETPARDASFAADALSDVLRAVRLTGSLQFCFAPSGVWQTDATPSLSKLAGGPSTTIPFHVVAAGGCWLRMEGREVALAAGDVVAFPFGTGHALGAGDGGPFINPVGDLPPKPWRDVPLLCYGEGADPVRLLCGYLRCDAINFAPLRNALPSLLHARTKGLDDADWLRVATRQVVAEAERPRAGGLSLVERLTEVIFIELLRHEIAATAPGATGWLAALADPALGRCLALIHNEPRRRWTAPTLAAAAGLSRSGLAERFEAILGASPMRYLRDWRLHLAALALRETRRAIAVIADEAGYGTEAAFNRAFARTYGVPPARWRRG